MTENNNFIKIIELDNEAEARLLEAELDKREIPHTIRNFFDVGFDGIFQMQKGWGVVEAPPDYQEKIQEIYADLITEENQDD